MFALHQLDAKLWQLTLPAPELGGPPFGRPVNVYVIGGDAPALINTGHASQHRALSEGLRELGMSPGDITRIIGTSWSPACIGGASALSRADLLVFSPDMTRPRDHDGWMATQRDARLTFYDDLHAIAPQALGDLTRADYAARLERVWMPRRGPLRFAPLRAGHVVRLGELSLTVIAAPGPDPGHILLHEPQRKLLFTGELTLDGMPMVLDDARDYLTAMDRAASLEADLLLPLHGLVDRHGTASMRRSLKFIGNFMNSAPMALYGNPTLLEFAAQDLGFEPRDRARYLETLQVYNKLLEELGRAGMLETRGEGLKRRYAVGMNDPRKALRGRALTATPE